MVVPYEVVDLKPARGMDEIQAGLTDLAFTDLPVLAMEGAGATLDEALIALGPTLRDLAIVRRNRAPFPFDIRDGKKDRGMHVDDLPVMPEQEAITFNIHHTERGVGQGNFFRYQPAFLRDPFAVWAAQRSNQSNWFGGDDRMTELFNQGTVDDAYLVPVCYRATLPPGTAVAFKEGLPLAHGIVTLERPRYSKAQLFDMMIDRRFNITRSEISPTYL